MARDVSSDEPRRVLVTGASRGIGRAIAVALARDGFDISLNYQRSKADAEQTLAAITESGGSAHLMPFDVADREACAKAIASDLEARFRAVFAADPQIRPDGVGVGGCVVRHATPIVHAVELE